MANKPQADASRVATILSDAKLLGIEVAAKKHGVSSRTIRRWRVAADTDRPEVAAAVAENVNEARRIAVSRWAEQIEPAIDEAITYIRWAAADAKRKKAKPSAIMVQSLVSAIKTLSELQGKPDDEEASSKGQGFRIEIVPFGQPAAADGPSE